MAVTACVIGLGEAGGEIARDLAAAGWTVRGFDIDPSRRPEGVTVADTMADAVRGANVVLSLATAAAARDVASAAAPELRPGAVFADLNTSEAALKRQLAADVEARGALFADVAVLAPVLGRGLCTPLLMSGSGAQRLAELLRPLGASIEVLDGPAGAAASRKLIRSVFMKGLAAALLEGEAAARAAGCEDWFRQDAAATLAGADGQIVGRLLDGSRSHAGRRVEELRASAELLRELGVDPHVTEAAQAVLSELAR
jgi:3-hydroxyisobutyrate dehydrogenase-like beta-hydroxyacid dehydrogenase